MSNQSIRVGIVGLGKMGITRARELDRHPAALLTAGYDPRPEMFSECFPKVSISQSASELVHGDIDAVFVCTPNHFTPGIVIEALDAGKHVFCEKPPGRTVADIENIIAAEKRNPGLKLTFGFNHRYHGGIQEAKRIVDSGRLGHILWLRGIYGKSGGVGFESQWRSKKDLVGAGILLDQGIHMLDLFRFFMDDFVEVKSMVSTAYWDIDVEDNAFALLRDTCGRIAMLHSSSTQWKHRFSLEIYLSDGYICVNGILSSTRSYGEESVSVARKQLGEGTAQGKPREEILYFDADPSWELEVAGFLDNVLNDTPVESGNSEQALKAMRLVYEIYGNDETFMKSKSAPIME
ncbi:MAG TPA: Gfo/Idh/MocA family oxidoreductase [Candidatus Hydrogenedentes bacterium]|nr:Gfo/Idh/MocA family oxidoreductase [Candidatus Hydrogenedentota bacterium]